jgi:mono/diheme cytochrome c family protein
MKTKLITALVIAAATFSLTAADVKEIWTRDCQKCHGEDGKGQTKMGTKAGVKDYTDIKVQAELKDENATKAIKEGIKADGKEKMKAYGDKLNDEEVKALVGQMRSFKK